MMNDNEFRLQREVRELKAEIRRLKRMMEGTFVIIGLGVVILFPQLALYVVVLCFFAFLVSPVRRLIFSYIFGKRDGHAEQGPNFNEH